jgi:hypothetical protein
MKKSRKIGLVVGALVVATFGGCGTNDEAAPDRDLAQPAPQQEEQPGSECRKASKKLMTAVAAGLEVSGGEGALRRGRVVRSKDFDKVFMVAADIQGQGLEGSDDVGVWATNSPTGEGLIFAVDGVAQEFSDWGDADATDAAITSDSHGVEEARACAKR